MKFKLQFPSRMSSGLTGLGMAALLFGSTGAASAQAVYTNNFDTTSSPMRYDFGTTVANSVNWSTNDANGSPSSGSAQLNWQWAYPGSGGQGADFTGDFLPANVNYAGATVSFDLFVDTNSIPGGYGDYGYFQVNTRNNGYAYGPSYLNKGLVGAGNLVPVAGQWGHISFVLGAEASSLRALTFQDYNDSGRHITGAMTIYIDNFRITPAEATNIPVISISQPIKGLNVFGNSSDKFARESARLKTSSGLSWVGQATVANPVTYSFTINSFPQNPATYGATAYLWLIPNPPGTAASADYNYTNGVIISVSQSSATNANLTFQYKVNLPSGNNMYYGLGVYTNAPGSWNGVTTPYYESGKLGSVTNSGTAIGTWSVKFTSDTNLTLTAPNGSTASYVLPAYNAGYFAETTGFNAYLGYIPTAVGAVGTEVVYANFAISGSVNPISDNFLTDTVLNTNNWDTSVAAAPKTVLVVPATAAYWLDWTNIPLGFSLQVGSSLTNRSAWTSPNLNPVVPFYPGLNRQLVDQSELPAGNVGFFNVLKRTFTKLQILLPGQTNAPGTALGYVGTPTPQSVNNITPITVNAVDATFNMVGGVSDNIAITTSDSGAFLPNPIGLVNGTVTISGANGFQFQTPGPQTITATDTSNTNIAAVVSASVTVTP